MKTKLVVSSGQYETAAIVVTVNHKTWRGLLRRIKQLENEHAVFGDNFAGWIKAQVALVSDLDRWADNKIIGGQWCEPNNGWLDEEDYCGCMSYRELQTILFGEIK